MPVLKKNVSLQSDFMMDGSIAHRLTFLLHRVVALSVEVAMPYFRSLGVNVQEARTLIGLYEAGPLTVGRLCELVCIDQSTVSHLLRRLEAQGLVLRTRQQHDNRSVMVEMTKAGKVIAKKCRQASIEHEIILVDGMAIEDQEYLKTMLCQLYANAKKGFGQSSNLK